MAIQPDLSRLKSQLLTSGLQQKDNPTFQVINQLIDSIKRIQDIINDNITNLTNTINNAITNINSSRNFNQYPYMMESEEVNESFSVSNPSSVPTNSIIYAPLTDGNTFETLLIFASGECIMAVET